MHRKSLEAAEHLKEQDNCNSNSDHEETTSMRTDASDTSATSNQQSQAIHNSTINNTSGDKDSPHHAQSSYSEDPEAFRNNSIACLRAKAQEHSAKLLNHGLMLQVRSNVPPQSCDANANNLHHQEVVSSDNSSSVFWQTSAADKWFSFSWNCERKRDFPDGYMLLF